MKPKQNMCLTCMRSTVETYERELGPDTIYCSSLEKEMTREVYECSSHSEQNAMDIGEHNQIAWIIDPGKGGKIGFVRPGTPRHKKVKSTTPGDTW